MEETNRTLQKEGILLLITLFFILGPVLPVHCEGHLVVLSSEFQQPPHGNFPMCSPGVTTSFPVRSALKWLPSKFSNIPSDGFQTNSIRTQGFISTLADGFLLASPRLLHLSRLLQHSGGYRNPVHWDLNLSPGGWDSICRFVPFLNALLCPQRQWLLLISAILVFFRVVFIPS